jgi:hypothetical protein
MSNFKFRVDVRTNHAAKIPPLAGMLRGLLNHFEGFGALTGLRNDSFHQKEGVVLTFSSRRNARALKKISDHLLGNYMTVSWENYHRW